jgi:GntR family transcriptional regulator, rspAB operon transcriptional repressor
LGAPLSRRKLAQNLKMSFIPISDALQRLENEGLVESKPRVGTRVKIPTEDDVRDRYILREALETQAARLFSVRASEEEKQELVRMASHLDRLYEVCANETSEPDFLFSVHTYHLHLRIAEATGSKALRDAIEMKQVLISTGFMILRRSGSSFRRIFIRNCLWNSPTESRKGPTPR